MFGIRSEATQKQLPTQSDIALSKVIQLALSKEAAQKDSQALKSTIPEVHRVTYKPRREEKACYHCGNANHTSSACSFREAKCRACRKIGHIAQVCRSKTKRAAVETVPQSSKQAATKKTNWLSSESPTHTHTHSPIASPQTKVIWQLRSDNASRPPSLPSSLGGESAVSH